MESKGLVLIGTSNANDMRMLQALLMAHAYDVITAVDTNTLRLHFKKNLPSVVIIDCDLAGSDVTEVCRLIKLENTGASFQFVGIVPMFDSRMHERMLNSGINDFVFKPFSADELIIRVRSAIERQRLAEECNNLERLLFSIASAFESRDEFKVGHPERVARMSRRLGERINLSSEEQELLYKGGMLHDIGMVRVPKSVAEKPGALTSDEFEQMKLHTVWGDRLCRPIHSLAKVLPIIRHHHEQVDGKGYPDGLSGNQIPRLARIMAISEVFDALASDRSYRARLKREDSMRYLKEYAQRQWLDATLVEEFLKMVSEEGWPTVPATEQAFMTPGKPTVSERSQLL